MKQFSSKGGESKKQSQASGVQINSNLGSGRPPASKGSERGTSTSQRKGGSGALGGQERSPR